MNNIQIVCICCESHCILIVTIIHYRLFVVNEDTLIDRLMTDNLSVSVIKALDMIKTIFWHIPTILSCMLDLDVYGLSLM